VFYTVNSTSVTFL